MSRSLLSGFRLRIADSNFNSPDAAYRIVFTDSSTTDPKVVYAGPDIGDTSLGSIVNLDSQGYVPVSGIWLDTGRYNAEVQVLVASDPEDWDEVFTLRKIQGGTDTTTTDDTTIRFVDTIAGIRAISLDELGGMVFNSGYYALNDGGQGKYRWNSTSLSPDDGGSSLLPTGQSAIIPGRWERVFDGNIYNIRMWGAIPGIADVSANIEKADLYCSRTSDDTGNTLVFPAGKYAIGAATLVFDAIGLTDGGIEKPVHYVIEENASFSGTLGSSVTFDGPTTVETSQSIYPFLTLNNVVGGFVRPEWWGAIGDGVTDDSTAFKYCWNGSNYQAIDLKGTYFLDLDEVYNGETTKGPKVRFRTGSSIIIGDSFDVQIGNVDIESAYDAVITGNLQFLQLTGSFYKSSWFGLDAVAKLSALTTAAQAHSTYELYWDNNFTFDNTFTDSSSIVHSFSPLSVWNLATYDIEVDQMHLPSSRTYFQTTTGTINVRKLYEIDPAWFGAIGTNVQIYINAMFLSVVAYNYNVDWKSAPTIISDTISLQTSATSDLVIRNLNISSTNLSSGLLDIGNEGNVSIIDSKISYSTASTSNAIRVNYVNLTMHDCVIDHGYVYIASSDSIQIYDNKIIEGRLIIKTSGTDHLVQNNTLINSEIHYLPSDLGVLQYLTSKGNNFISDAYPDATFSNETSAFQHLVPTGIMNSILKTQFVGNIYKNNSVGSFPALGVSNILSDGDGVINGWDTTIIHELVIKDEVEFSSNVGNNGDQKEFVTMRFTHGWKRFNLAVGFGQIDSGTVVSTIVNMWNFELPGTTSGNVQVMAGNIGQSGPRDRLQHPILCNFTILRVVDGNAMGDVAVDWYMPYGTPWVGSTPTNIDMQCYISQTWEGAFG